MGVHSAVIETVLVLLVVVLVVLLLAVAERLVVAEMSWSLE
jgi:preprotein translocase subunit SecE